MCCRKFFTPAPMVYVGLKFGTQLAKLGFDEYGVRSNFWNQNWQGSGQGVTLKNLVSFLQQFKLVASRLVS